MGNPVPVSASEFPYGNAACDLTCSPSVAPYSPIRRGSTNNIYVIPEPTRLKFGLAILLSAACCVPAVIMLLKMYNKILEMNWKRRFDSGNRRLDEPIEGTNNASAHMGKINALVKRYFAAMNLPLCMGLELYILVLGERNFFSAPVMYQTEPMSSIGKQLQLLAQNNLLPNEVS